ncbi:unnamed protein product [Paramecium sonneborni]|uniref:Uncharacterized protein n=1 Tax=Paramecium sonneborni TaxID=65129 RepID=A0A8S1QV37_9CILI|nr:unnamed protein product [Paramecium sonneborni]
MQKWCKFFERRNSLGKIQWNKFCMSSECGDEKKPYKYYQKEK